MLGKLYKHEFKETAKPLIPLNLVLIVFTIIGAIMLGTDILQNESFEILAVTCMMLYIMSIFTVFIVTMVYLTIRFYKTMYSRQGYLTHTLPVSTGSIINTKIIVSSLWMFVSMIITGMSVFILVKVTAGSELDAAAFQEAVTVFPEIFGMELAEFVIWMIVLCVISCIASVLMLFVSLSIGQLFHQHRVLASIIAYVVIYIIQQIIGTVSVLIMGIGNLDELAMDTASSTLNMASFYRGTFWMGLIQSLIFGIIFYVLCHYFTKKKLNLE
ncbi:MAG: hypothetical protein J6A75_13020 [Lachnospiraceae bacterium]|nr:hypothetical protein [Lachnospiraceae bacterium]